MIRSFLTLAFCFIVNAYASAQLFQVPARVTFGNVVVNMNTGAQDLVQTDVNALLSNRNTLNSRLDRAVLYFPIVENILAEENVPADFKYLVMQESGLAPDAVSTSNAVGFWQFKKETAQEFGLRVDDEIDERKNIHASTRAAARYLKKNNAVTQNWVSTLYSYYLGLGGIRSLVPTEWSTAKDISVTEKTDRYILRCLAHKLVYESELKGYRTGQTPFYEYKAAGGKTFTQVADQLGVDEVELRRYNRWVGGSKVPQDKEYTMLVVVSNNPNSPVIASAANGRPTVVQPTAVKPAPSRPKDPEFPVLKRITPTGKNQSNGPIFYEINGKKGILAQEGDTYQTIADRADIKYSRFLSRNDMSESDAIVAGKVYYLQKKARKGNVPTHTLQHGESIWDVSQMYGIRLPFLLRLNRIASESEPLQPGRVLNLQKRISCDVAPEVVPLPDPEPEKPATEEKPVTDVVTTQPATTTEPAAPGDVKVTPSNTTAPQKSSGRVVLVDENGKVVSGNTTQPATQPATRPADNQAVNRPAATPPARTEPSPAVTYPARPAVEKPKPAPVEEVAPSGDANSFHTVQGGETFYSIARKYQMTPGELRRLNGFTDYPNVRIGQRLRVIGGVSPDEVPMTAKQPTVAPKPNVTAPAETSGASQYTVGPGDTFYSIARKHGISPEELRDINGLTDFPRVKVGDKLMVKAGAKATETSRLPSNRATGGVTTHIIQSGETLHSISRKYDVKVKDIMEWNNISSANAIQAGQKLKIRKP